MAKTKIKYITFAPKAESTWNTPEEKQAEKIRVIADASEKMVASLIARNKKSKTMDYRGIYYNGKLGLILVCKKLPDDAVATDYAKYVVKFDLDAASSGGGTIDETTINNLIKKFLQNNPIEDKDTKEYILIKDIANAKEVYDAFKDLADKDGNFVNYGSVDNFEQRYPGFLSQYTITIDPDDKMRLTNYKVVYKYKKDTHSLDFDLFLTGITEKGKMVTANIGVSGSETNTSALTHKKSEESFELSKAIGTPIAPAKFVELEKLNTPKNIFESLDSLKTNGKYKTSGAINDPTRVRHIVSNYSIESHLGEMAGKEDTYTRITWDIDYIKPSDTDPINSILNMHLESRRGRRAIVHIIYNNAPATQDSTENRVVSSGLIPILIRPPFDPAFKGHFAPSNLRQLIKDYYVEEYEYPIELSGVILDKEAMEESKQYYTETDTAVVNPIALLYEIKIELTGANYFTGKVKLTWILENGKKVLLSGEYENASGGLATPGDQLKNRVVRVIEPVGGSGTPTESKQIMDYQHKVYADNKPSDIKARYTPYLKTGTNEAYLEGTIVDNVNLVAFRDAFSSQVTEGVFEPIAILYEIFFKDNGNNTINYNEILHFIMEDGRQLQVFRSFNNSSTITDTETFNISSRMFPAQVSKKDFESVKEKITKIEKTVESLEEKRLTESIAVGGEVLIETFKGELKEGPKIEYSMNVGLNLGHHIREVLEIGGNGSVVPVAQPTNKYNILRRNGELFIPRDIYEKSINGDGRFYERVYERFMQDFKGANNVFSKNMFEFDVGRGFPSMNVIGAPGSVENHPLYFVIYHPIAGQDPMTIDPQEIGIGVNGEEILPPMTSGVTFDFVQTVTTSQGEKLQVSKVSFTDSMKYTDLMDKAYRVEAEKCFGTVLATQTEKNLDYDNKFFYRLGVIDSYPIHKTCFGPLVGGNDKRDLKQFALSEVEDSEEFDKIKSIDEFESYQKSLKDEKYPFITSLPYLYTESFKDPDKNPNGVIGFLLTSSFTHDLTGYYIKEKMLPELQEQLGTTFNLTASFVEMKWEKEDGQSPDTDEESPILVTSFDLASDGVKIGRIVMRHTLDVVRQYYYKSCPADILQNFI